MHRFLPFVIGLAALSPAQGRASPALLMHMLGFGKFPCVDVGADDPPCALPAQWSVLLPNIVGPQLSIPWSAVQTDDPQGFDWTRVENAIRPWRNAGKQVAISFHAVEESAGVDQTGIPATPAFILSPAHAGDGPALISCRFTSHGKTYVAPTVPVYWDTRYATPWRAFASAAIAYFAGRSDIAYLRFGEGEGDESMIEVNKTPYGAATQSSINSCNAKWNQIDKTIGGNGVLADHLAQATALVTLLGQVAAATPGAPPLFGSYNDLGGFQTHAQPQPHPFADPLAAAEAAAGLAPGNEGYGAPQQHSKDETNGFAGIYQWNDPYFGENAMPPPAGMYMQTSAPALRERYTTLPPMLQSAVGYGIGTFEMYPADLFVIFDPTNSSGLNPYDGRNPTPACLSKQSIAALNGAPLPKC
jgi:hypothetical protein